MIFDIADQTWGKQFDDGVVVAAVEILIASARRVRLRITSARVVTINYYLHNRSSSIALPYSHIIANCKYTLIVKIEDMNMRIL